MNESTITHEIIAYLAARRYLVWRRNVAGIIVMPHGGRAKIGERGQADLWGWDSDSGRHIEIEVKAPGNKPTAAQESWLSLCRAGGCIAFWADSREMCQTKLLEQI